MSNLWPLASGSNLRLTDGGQAFLAFGGNRRNLTENQVQQEVRDSYTASNLRVYLGSTLIGPNVILTFRLNAADGSQTITATGSGESEDTTNTDSLVSGDLIDLDADQSAGAHGDEFTVASFQTTLDASTDVPFIAAASESVASWVIDAGTTEFAAFQGTLINRSAVGDVEYTMRTTRTLRDLRVFCNTFANNTTVTIQKNQVDGNLTVTVTGTGEFLDTSNTDSFVAGDEVDIEATSVGTMSITTFTTWATEGDTPTTVQMYSALGVGTAASFFRPSGNVTTATEAETEIEAEGIATIQNLFVNCFTHAETRTIRTRKNQANGAASISVTGTGLFEDTSNTDTLAAEDDLAIQQDAGSAGTNDYLIAVEWDGAVAAAGFAHGFAAVIG